MVPPLKLSYPTCPSVLPARAHLVPIPVPLVLCVPVPILLARHVPGLTPVQNPLGQ